MSDLDFSNFDQDPKPARQSNRTFVVIAGILGAIILVALVAAAAYAILVLPQRNAANAQLAVQKNAENTATVMAATSAVLTMTAPTETPEPRATEEPTSTPEPTATPEPTSTPMVLGGGLPEDQAMTATVSALLTQAAESKPGEAEVTMSADAEVTATALPTTGFADEMGIPTLVGLGVLFLVLIVVTRQARLSRSR